jgi:protein-disulfide isomerase
MTPESVRAAAREIGGVTNSDGEYASVLPEIRKDIELGHALGVTGTPTFFINGVRIFSGLKPEYLDAAVAYELRTAAQAKP